MEIKKKLLVISIFLTLIPAVQKLNAIGFPDLTAFRKQTAQIELTRTSTEADFQACSPEKGCTSAKLQGTRSTTLTSRNDLLSAPVTIPPLLLSARNELQNRTSISLNKYRNYTLYLQTLF